MSENHEWEEIYMKVFQCRKCGKRKDFRNLTDKQFDTWINKLKLSELESM